MSSAPGLTPFPFPLFDPLFRGFHVDAQNSPLGFCASTSEKPKPLRSARSAIVRSSNSRLQSEAIVRLVKERLWHGLKPALCTSFAHGLKSVPRFAHHQKRNDGPTGPRIERRRASARLHPTGGSPFRSASFSSDDHSIHYPTARRGTCQPMGRSPALQSCITMRKVCEPMQGLNQLPVASAGVSSTGSSTPGRSFQVMCTSVHKRRRIARAFLDTAEDFLTDRIGRRTDGGCSKTGVDRRAAKLKRWMLSDYVEASPVLRRSRPNQPDASAFRLMGRPDRTAVRRIYRRRSRRSIPLLRKR
jgi:hypothetical protein